jgi:hypothetical protein
VAEWTNPVAGGIALLVLAVVVLRFLPDGLSRRAA